VYQAYPSYPSQASSPEPAPASVRWAAYLMCAGAVEYLISGIVGLMTAINEAPKILDGAPAVSGSPVLGEAVHGLRVVLVIVAALSLVVPVALWLWMAWKCKAGRRWARVFSTVLFAIATWGTISLRSGSTSPWGVLGAIVGWVIGLAVIVLLWQRSASYYFRDSSRY
jgi:hypothetical protein